MKKIVARIMDQGNVTYVPSRKEEGGQLAKCTIRFREIGGDYEDEYVATAFGNLALCKYYLDDIVVAVLRFSTRQVNTQVYQDIVVNEIVKLNKK